MQPEFTAALLRAAKHAGLHTCLDTCGSAPQERFAELLGCVDLFLFDLKNTDPLRHHRITGVRLGPILQNLRAIKRCRGRTILRCPLVPGLNADDGHVQSRQHR